MKKVIWKFPLLTVGMQNVKMPIDSEILCVQNQNDTPCLWALVYPEKEIEERCIEMFGTGHNIYCDMGVDRKYLSTIQLNDGELVFHFFERF